MDSQFIDYDGRSVHDMIQTLLAASGDPEAIRQLQQAIQAVDAKFTPVNTELARLEDDKQDAGYYVENGGGLFGTSARFDTSANIGKFVQGTAVKGVRIYGQHATESRGYKGQSIVFNDEAKSISHYVVKAEDDSYELMATYSADEDTGWLTATLATGVTGTVEYRKKNGVVFLRFNGISFATALSVEWSSAMLTLPAGFRPNSRTIMEVYYGTYGSAHVQIQSNGEVSFAKDSANTSTNGSLYGLISFPTN